MKHKPGFPLRPLAAPHAAAAARGALRLGAGEFFKNGLGSAASGYNALNGSAFARSEHFLFAVREPRKVKERIISPSAFSLLGIE
jgi:hypothetical protein